MSFFAISCCNNLSMLKKFVFEVKGIVDVLFVLTLNNILGGASILWPDNIRSVLR